MPHFNICNSIKGLLVYPTKLNWSKFCRIAALHIEKRMEINTQLYKRGWWTAERQRYRRKSRQ